MKRGSVGGVTFENAFGKSFWEELKIFDYLEIFDFLRGGETDPVWYYASSLNRLRVRMCLGKSMQGHACALPQMHVDGTHVLKAWHRKDTLGVCLWHSKFIEVSGHGSTPSRKGAAVRAYSARWSHYLAYSFWTLGPAGILINHPCPSIGLYLNISVTDH